ncbi:hypothetical protein Asi02nite_15990 [Asanoa siamensis]|uniref:Uncharacterized protein n=1 Tax=Asanoa siamensis TaxID=926357 RepID=A0ABQ4CLB2_9ACTN|nr:hypothetical protein Asi02nite_15990 [Asanoa siamensis]
MTALLELAPRDAGTIPEELHVEFVDSASLHEVVACYVTCTIRCNYSDSSHFAAEDEILN